MKTRALFACVLMACESTAPGSKLKDPIVEDEDPVKNAPDGGISSDDVDDEGPQKNDAGTPDAGDDLQDPEDDAGSKPTDDAGPSVDPVAAILEDLAELTTCKPSQINPVGDCLNVTCANTDRLAAAQCALEQCIPLIEGVDKKCGDCLVAAIAQDTLGLLNCIDAEAILKP